MMSWQASKTVCYEHYIEITHVRFLSVRKMESLRTTWVLWSLYVTQKFRHMRLACVTDVSSVLLPERSSCLRQV